MKKAILLPILLMSAIWSFGQQTTPPVKQEKQYMVPFTYSQMIDLNKELARADSAAINGHNVMPSFNLLRTLVSAFNQAYNVQSQQALTDSLKKQPTKKQ